MVWAQTAGCSGDDPTIDPATTDTYSATGCNLIRAGAAWWNLPIARQTARFHVEFDATPSQTDLDAVVGISNGTAGSFSKLATIVRFNPSGMIDARAGADYRADASYPYQAGATYHIRIDVDLPAHMYSVRVSDGTISGNRTIATNYPFRTEQAGVTQLTNVASKIDSAAGTLQVCGVDVGAGILTSDGCLQVAAGDGVASMGLRDGTAIDTVDFSATPGNTNVDAVIGLSAGAATGFDSIATAVRFAPNGVIDVRDGDGYRADVNRPYGTGNYNFRMLADLSSHRYSVFQGTSAEAAEIGRQYAFRTSQAAVTHLDHLNVIVDGTSGSVKVCNPATRLSTDIAYSREGDPSVAPLADGTAIISDGTTTTHVDAAGQVLQTQDAIGGMLTVGPDHNVWVARIDAPTQLRFSRLDANLQPTFTRTVTIPSGTQIQTMGLRSNGTGLVGLVGNGSVYLVDSTGVVFQEPGNAIANYYDLEFVASWTSTGVQVTAYSLEGNVIWERTYDGSVSIDRIATDPNGAVLFGGRFYSPIDFGGGTLKPYPAPAENPSSNAYLVKLTASGDFVFARHTNDTFIEGISSNGTTIAVSGTFETQFWYPERHTYDASGNEIATVGDPGFVDMGENQWGQGRRIVIGPDGRVYWNLIMMWPLHSSWPFMVATTH